MTQRGVKTLYNRLFFGHNMLYNHFWLHNMLHNMIHRKERGVINDAKRGLSRYITLFCVISHAI